MTSAGVVRDGARWLRVAAQHGNEQLTDTVGGRAGRKAILMLAAVVSLSGADIGAIGRVGALSRHRRGAIAGVLVSGDSVGSAPVPTRRTRRRPGPAPRASASGLLLLRARRKLPTDVATAAA